MNLRTVTTELFQKPTGRLALFLLTGALILAFVFAHRGSSSPEPVNPTIPAQATAAKGYSFSEDIPPTSPTRAPKEAPTVAENATARPSATPKPPPSIPQAIFATREASRSENYLPFGRLLRCELVNTVDSTNIETPIIGLIMEDVWHDGRLIITAGTEVHGIAQKPPLASASVPSGNGCSSFRTDGKCLSPEQSSTTLQTAVRSETDGSAGLRGYMIAADKYAEAKAVLAAMISAGAGAFPQMQMLSHLLLTELLRYKVVGFRMPSRPEFRPEAKSIPSAFWMVSTKSPTMSAYRLGRSFIFMSPRLWTSPKRPLAFPPQTKPIHEVPHLHPRLVCLRGLCLA